MRRDAMVGPLLASQPGSRPADGVAARLAAGGSTEHAPTVSRCAVDRFRVTSQDSTRRQEPRNPGPEGVVNRPPRTMVPCDSPPPSSVAPRSVATSIQPVGSDLMLTDLSAHVDDWMAVCGHSDATRQVTTHTLGRLVRFANAHEVVVARDVTPELVRSFIEAPGSDRRRPAIATMHQRRSVVRLAFRLYHRVDPTVVDPTYDLVLAPRSTLSVRPLTDDELDVLRAVSLHTLFETRQPAIVALAEAGAVTTEIAAVTRDHIDLDGGTASLPGARHATPRTVPLTEWGATQLARRSRDSTGPLTYQGGGVGNAAQVSISVALRRMFTAAGFGRETDLRLASVRASAGRRAFDETGRIEDAARVLGCSSLDTAARLIGWEWT